LQFLRLALRRDALDALSNQPVAAPSYIALASTANQGAIIERDRNGPFAVYQMGSIESSWYLCVTNYDLNSKSCNCVKRFNSGLEPDPPRDPRRTIADAGLNALGQNSVDPKSLYGVLSLDQVLNSGTTYTAIMCSETGFYQTTVRDSQA
jgi:hypothetical protein